MEIEDSRSACDIFIATPYTAACDALGGHTYRAYVEALCGYLEAHGLAAYAAPRNEEWGKMRPPRRVGILRDQHALSASSVVIALAGSHVADGVLVEIGMAIALRRRLYIFRTGTSEWPAYLDGVIECGDAECIHIASATDILRGAARVADEFSLQVA